MILLEQSDELVRLPPSRCVIVVDDCRTDLEASVPVGRPARLKRQPTRQSMITSKAGRSVLVMKLSPLVQLATARAFISFS